MSARRGKQTRTGLGETLEPLAVRRHDAARLLGLSESGLRLLEQRGEAPPRRRAGRSVLYVIADLRRWLEETR
jgi:hypothetical protein